MGLKIEITLCPDHSQFIPKNVDLSFLFHWMHLSLPVRIHGLDGSAAGPGHRGFVLSGADGVRPWCLTRVRRRQSLRHRCRGTPWNVRNTWGDARAHLPLLAWFRRRFTSSLRSPSRWSPGCSGPSDHAETTAQV